MCRGLVKESSGKVANPSSTSWWTLSNTKGMVLGIDELEL